MTRRRLVVLSSLCATVLVAPGWSGRLETVEHEVVLAAARAADPLEVFGVARPGARPGETWHVQYNDSPVARLLRSAGMRGALPSVVPPRFVAHVPAGAEHADGYFRVRTSLHWPWWRPGGGLDWEDPRVSSRR